MELRGLFHPNHSVVLPLFSLLILWEDLFCHPMCIEPLFCLTHQVLRCTRNVANAFVYTRPEDDVVLWHFRSLFPKVSLNALTIQGKQCLIAFFHETCYPCTHTHTLSAPAGAYTSILSHLRLLKLLTITTRQCPHSSFMVPCSFLKPVTFAPQFGQCHVKATHSSRFITINSCSFN